MEKIKIKNHKVQYQGKIIVRYDKAFKWQSS